MRVPETRAGSRAALVGRARAFARRHGVRVSMCFEISRSRPHRRPTIRISARVSSASRTARAEAARRLSFSHSIYPAAAHNERDTHQHADNSTARPS